MSSCQENEENYSVLVCFRDKQGNVLSTQKVLCVAIVFCVYCKVMYVDGSEWDNDFKDDKVISGDGSEDKQEVVMCKDSF